MLGGGAWRGMEPPACMRALRGCAGRLRWAAAVGGCGVGLGEGRACQPVMEKVLPAEETVSVRSNMPGSAAKCWCGSPE